MVREAYESPKMEFEEVRLNQAVANTCWGYHGTGTNMYADINGKESGYYSFQIAEGSCTLSLTNVVYYSSKDASGVGASATQKQSLYDYLIKQGGDSGNPFKGEGSTVFPDEPGPSFS